MESLSKELLAHKQDHLLCFWDELPESERQVLREDLEQLDVTNVMALFDKAISTFDKSKELLDKRIYPVPDDVFSSLETCTNVENYRNLGLQEIADGKVAVLLMTGGQGTRLGVDYPKGMYNVGLPSGKTLFELQALQICRLQEIAHERFNKSGEIVWYLMTSDATHDSIVSFLRKKNFFGLKEENIVAFQQGMVPCFTFDGKIILDDKHRVSKAPDGNGGLYQALVTQNIIEDMRERGIRSVHAHSVDNILTRVADPIFIGYCLSLGAECGNKVVEKSSPSEAVGVVCQVDRKYRVVEYSEISKETSELRRPDGQLLYNAGNICNHYFTVDFLARVCHAHGHELDLHVAKKKIPYVDEEGVRRTPNSPNGIKIEKFIFDVFKYARKFAVWQVPRRCEFSPVKNKDSAMVDCPSTARKDVLALHRKWLLDAGALAVDGDVEISPLVSYAGENLRKIAEGRTFRETMVIDTAANS